MQDKPVEINRARTNHAIWNARPMAVCRVPAETLSNSLGNPENGRWCVRDGVTGAHLMVQPIETVSPVGEVSVAYALAWIDGPRAPGSGRNLAEAVCGEGLEPV